MEAARRARLSRSNSQHGAVQGTNRCGAKIFARVWSRRILRFWADADFAASQHSCRPPESRRTCRSALRNRCAWFRSVRSACALSYCASLRIKKQSCCTAYVAYWHWAAERGCPHSRRVLEGKRTILEHCESGALIAPNTKLMVDTLVLITAGRRGGTELCPLAITRLLNRHRVNRT